MEQGVLEERYELLEHIGGGGMADVYKAHDTVLDRMVAVKILHAQLAGDEDFLEKFHLEAKGAARLSHPNIVGIYDVGQDAERHYIVMEYIAGETLKKKIQREGRLSVEESLRIAKEIARALREAHANNLVHCDIKPHNILVTPDGRVKVADFGIARAVTSSTMTYNGNVVGSVHYFSPEQAKGTKITPKSDIYSLGVVLYEMLTGELPFTGETTVSIALKHLQEEPRPVCQHDRTLPPMVEAIVQKAMAKDPLD
ncbi:MAG: serine/threonine protein kinase, partial [Schwartzia sp.]|nr:serine/threonine protein kinase [Schwartzia sp. (in: firmicutes)]